MDDLMTNMAWDSDSCTDQYYGFYLEFPLFISSLDIPIVI